jgi:acylphosphatase
MAASTNVRREVYFRGRVQGVGFRFATREVAGRFAVTGFVENLSDGRVRLVAEGTEAEVDRFTTAVLAEMDRFIVGHDVEPHPATGEFDDFSIRH